MTLINSRKFKISNHQAKKVKPIMETEFAELGGRFARKVDMGEFWGRFSHGSSEPLDPKFYWNSFSGNPTPKIN